MNKIKAQDIHAIRRAKERYGVQLNVEDLKQIANKIKSGDSIPVDKRTLRVSVHMVVHKETAFRVAYDKTRKTICTFLPPNEGE